ncbi:MAG: hypothetical protein RMK49_08475 [Abditibacteriales bacterium]|nr:hypothetical protein [Abditibacteriales bacterium]
MPESHHTLVPTTDEEATTLTPLERTFLQAFAQEVMQYDFVEAVLYDKRGEQLYVRTVMSVFELDPMRSVVRTWGNAIRSHPDMVRMPFPDHLMVHPPRTAQDVAAAGFRILAQK